MEVFSPLHQTHRRVPWPDDLKSISIMIPASFIPLLAHNNPPDEGEVGRVRKYRDQRLQLISLNKIARQQHKITSLNDYTLLQTTHIRLRKQVFVCDVILSPFRNIPTDHILYEIIMHCPITHPLFGNSNNPETHMPTILGRTSHSWRRVARTVSSLWQEMRVECKNSELGTRKTKILRTIEHFSRLSGVLPFGIKLDGGEGVYTTTGIEGLSRILMWIFKKWHGRRRLTKLHVRTHGTFHILQLLRALVKKNKPLPNLKSLLLMEPYVAEGMLEPQQTTITGQGVTEILTLLPELRHVFLGDRPTDLYDLFMTPTNLLGSWEKVTHLYIGNWVTTLEWQLFLRICPNLEAGWFHLQDEIDHPSARSLVPLVHCRIKELILIFGIYNQELLIPFVGIQLPTLSKLQVHIYRWTRMFPLSLQPLLPDDFVKVFPSLKTIQFHHSDGAPRDQFDIDDILRFLLATPSVTSLSIPMPLQSTVHAFLNALCQVQAGSDDRKPSYPLPNLQDLQLKFITTTRIDCSSWCSDLDIEDEVTNVMIKALNIRWPSPPRSMSGIPPSTTENWAGSRVRPRAPPMTVTFTSYPDKESNVNMWEYRMKYEMKSYFTRIRSYFQQNGIDIEVEIVESERLLGDMRMHQLQYSEGPYFPL